MLKSIFIVGIGSFIGGAIRYIISTLMKSSCNTFLPWGTLAVNLIGCFIIGALYALFSKYTSTSNSLFLLLTTQQLDIYGTASAYQGPVLIIHGKNDRLVPLWCSQQYLTTYPTTTSQLTIVEGENHRISRRTRQVAALVTQLFKQH